MHRSEISDTWEQGSHYERYIGRWSRLIAPLFLSWLDIPADRAWLDVGCGTGALSAAILDRCSPRSVIGLEPSAGFLEAARANLRGRVELLQGGADEIPLDDAAVDVVVSGLVLNFVPDQHAALAEMARVIADGGTVALYVWDYTEGMELIRHFWDAAVELDSGAAVLDEGVRFPSCRPDALSQLLIDAGLHDVAVHAIDVQTLFASFDDYWQPFLGGQGPAPAYAMSLGENARALLRERVRDRLPIQSDGSIELSARAWAARARVVR